MTKEERKKADEVIDEMDFAVKHYGLTPAGFARIVELGKNLRDIAFLSHGLDKVEKEHAFELIREAKLFALKSADAQLKLEKLEMLEDDLRRVS